MSKGIRTGDPHVFNKGRSSRLREGSRVRQKHEEGRRTYRPKRGGNNNKDEDNSLKTLNDTWDIIFLWWVLYHYIILVDRGYEATWLAPQT